MLGDVRKVFTWARNMAAGGSDKALVEEATRGTGLIAGGFEEVARDERIPAVAREAAERGLAHLKRQQGEIATMASHYR